MTSLIRVLIFVVLCSIAVYLGGRALITAAGAQANPCAYKIQMEGLFKKKYQEVTVASGVARGGQTIIEIYVSPSGTFTIIESRADGIACFLATGTDWQALPVVVGEKS
jgi:hypothetical protein